MVKNVVDIFVGLLIVVAVVVLCNNWYQKARVPDRRDHYKLYANFTDITGLEIGSDVKISGIPVGYVSGYVLDIASYTANIAMEINNSVLIPTDTMASVSSDGLFGRKYLKLTPGSLSLHYKENETITLTQPAMNIESLISSFLFKSNADS